MVIADCGCDHWRGKRAVCAGPCLATQVSIITSLMARGQEGLETQGTHAFTGSEHYYNMVNNTEVW